MKQGQKFTLLRLVSNQQGQGVVEYVLLLIVTVSLILAARGLFVGTKTFITDHVGKYTVCLMDHGELPQLGVTEADLKKHAGKGWCSFQFSAAINGQGSWEAGSGGSSGSGAGRGSKAADNTGQKSTSQNQANSEKNSNTSKNASRDAAGGSDLSSGGPYGRSVARAYANNRVRRAQSSAGVADGGVDDDQRTRLLSDGAASGEGRGSKNEDRTQELSSKGRYKALTGVLDEDLSKKLARKEPRQPRRSAASAKEEDGYRPGPRRHSFTPPEAKAQHEIEDKNEDFSFGYLLKWLIVAGMAVAIVIFFGGQILNYSNSDS